ncbi:MAG: hypothetical protein KJ726_04105, partial [Verrucomicrobia bacterium]|nr:hypothetical protein [Verrucomicrobiota bacterium]
MTRNRHLILQRHYYPLAILLTLCLHSVAPATSPLNDIQWQIIQNLKDAIAQSGTPDANVDLNPALFPSSTNLDQAARFLLVPAVMEINGLTAIRFSVLDRILRLKLLDETLIWDESRPDEIVQRMMDTFSRIRDKAQRPDCIIVAVPPLLGRNLSFEWSFLERTLAVVIENALLAYENIIVLAWEDAAALGPAGTTLGSGPPAIVLSVAGSFFVSITNDQPMIHLNLQTRKGDVVVSEKEAQMAWAADLPVRLAAVMGRLLAEEPLPPSGKIDAVILCRDLGTRSRTHLQLGAWGLAHAISEYVVLLCPGDYDARVTALGALCELAGYGHHSDAAERGIPRSFFPRRLWAAETGLKHVAPLLYNEALGDVRWRTLSTFRQSTMMQHYDFTKDPDDLAERFRDYCARRAFLYQDYLERHAADAAWM